MDAKIIIFNFCVFKVLQCKDKIGKRKPLFQQHTISNKCAKYEHLP